MIIANSCAGAFCYQQLSIQYDNPFISNVIEGKYWNLLLENFEQINWFNLEINKEYQYYAYPNNEHYFLLLDNMIKIWFPHYNSIEEIKIHWINRTNRMLNYFEKNDFKNNVLFVSCNYRTNSDDDNIITATKFNNIFQLIDIYGIDLFYKNIKLSKNTYLYNKQSKSHSVIGKYILSKFRKFI